MNAAQIERLRQAMLATRAELEASDAGAKGETQPVELDQSSVGRLTRMNALQGHEMALEEARRRQQQRAEIDGALRRIEAGEYGNCFVCGEAIDTRRLEVAPATTRCVKCKDAQGG
ncbi:MAG TPA: TraR/DksA C4-type zinc finger protein [Burkholderiales bacterium]